MKTKIRMLKVKIKSLSEETKLIRLEERRCGKDEQLRYSLHLHRIGVVRQELWASYIAYAFLRKRDLRDVVHAAGQPGWIRRDVYWVMKKARDIVQRFGSLQPSSSPEKQMEEESFKTWSQIPWTR